MKTFKQFVEFQNDFAADGVDATSSSSAILDKSQQIQSQPVFRIKENFTGLLDAFITWLDSASTQKVDDVINNVMNFKEQISSFNDKIVNELKDKNHQLQYKKLYESVLSVIDDFSAATSDINELISSLKSQVSIFYSFIQEHVGV